MTAPTTTRTQVQAYRFGMRRLERAVTTGESYRRSVGGPRPGLAFLIGVIVAVLVLGVFLVIGLVSPKPSIGDAKVVVDSDNGGVYVVRHKQLYPALNLASALLVAGADQNRGGDAGSNAKPQVQAVDSDTIRGRAKGQPLGIVGAPDRIPGEGDLVDRSWTVCDVSVVDGAKSPTAPPVLSTSVALGRPGPVSGDSSASALVSQGGRTYLLADARRAQVDLDDRAVSVALGTDGTTPRPISRSLLNAIPAGPEITAPKIPGAGQPAKWNSGLTVGTVFRVVRAAKPEPTTQYWAVLDDGAEAVTPVLANLIRADQGGSRTVPTLPLSTLKSAPTSHRIRVADYPSGKPLFSAVTANPAVCLVWNGTGGPGAYAVFTSEQMPLPPGATAVLAPPNAAADTAASVYLQPGHGQVLGQVTGDQKPETGALFLVTEQGVKYPVVSSRALAFLGLGKHVHGAPPALVNLLPTGPTLDPAVATAFFGAAK